MYYDSPAPLLENAAQGTESAWRDIVDRYSSLVSSVCRRYRISGADAQDVSGTVWLRLVANLKNIREPEALPGWLATTTRRECLILLRHKDRQIPTDSVQISELTDPEFDANLITEERRIAARHAVAQLPRRDQQLLGLLFCDPPMSYREISAALGIPVGAIGPYRARCLARARHTPAIAALLADDPRYSGGHTSQSDGAVA
jgi:RNA polymerase sigma factor (sigma-70 family)